MARAILNIYAQQKRSRLAFYLHYSSGLRLDENNDTGY